MKLIKSFILVFILTISCAWAQDAENAFHQAAGQYVKGSIQDARTTVASALQKYPNDPKLNSLMEKLKKENPENKDQEKQEEENQEENKEEKDKDPNSENNEGDNKDKEKDTPEKDESEENKEEEENKENAEENKEGEKGEKDEERSRSEKLQQMNLTEEKALSILEALKNSEIQYIQQNRRKVRENANYGKPDW